ncbi:MAG: hypothetical protein O3B27_05755 [Actinomycetota bacterium]|nr:hypothetical protein [Actinomycetota bacterium]MDA2991047.1 hypothetical protein [Actinomycetota bacterium]
MLRAPAAALPGRAGVDPGACPVVESALSEAAEESVGVATAVPDPATATDAPNPNATRKPLPKVALIPMMVTVALAFRRSGG